MAILIVGGAGYIGSHAARYFLERGENVVIADNLQSGHREVIDVIAAEAALVCEVPFYEIDIRNRAELDAVFKKHDIEAVVHFGADSIVGESMTDPSKYFNNNVYGTICLLDAMKENGVDKLVFSSSAAVYGDSDGRPLSESSPCQPTNAYGETKLMMEKMMQWYGQAYGIRSVALRYFNACGAWGDGLMGEDHSPETHLIPRILQTSSITIFGDDYPTGDGTCIRDYVHVVDLATAHHLALDYLRKGGESDVFNLGSGRGFSVLEIIEAARRVTGLEIPANVGQRRDGDPAVLVASAEKAEQILGWKPERSTINKIMADAWAWTKKARDRMDVDFYSMYKDL